VAEVLTLPVSPHGLGRKYWFKIPISPSFLYYILIYTNILYTNNHNCHR
jgi:hypothetical protein